jgi:hypothetical protein
MTFRSIRLMGIMQKFLAKGLLVHCGHLHVVPAYALVDWLVRSVLYGHH